MVDVLSMDKGDAGRLATLARSCGLDEWIDETTLQRFLLADPTSLPALRLLAIRDGTPCGFCGASLRDGQTVIQLFGVAPAYRRQGIATELFERIEQYSLAHGITRVQVTGMSGGYFFPGVPLDATPAICFLERRGYRTDRSARVDMDVDLASADLDTGAQTLVLAEQGIHIGRVGADGVAEVVQFAERYFSRTWGIEAGWARLAPEPTLFAAWYEGEVVSFAVYDTLGHARFGPTGTRPDVRQRGIGNVLLKRCMAAMRERGDRHAQIIWVGPLGFYARSVGARIHRAYWGFGKDLA